MRERLRKIAEQTFCDGIISFGKWPDVVTNIQQALKYMDCILIAALQDIIVRQPESASQKLALAMRHAVDGGVLRVSPHTATQ